MDTLEQKHYDAIEDRKVISDKLNIETYRLVPLGASERCAQVTKEVSVMFAIWVSANYFTPDDASQMIESNEWECPVTRKVFTTDELFNLFIEETYK